MLTAENIAANRRTLANLLREQLNLPADAGTWLYSQRIEYNRQFAAYVLAHPASFGAQDVQTAGIISAEMPSELSATSLSSKLSAFGSALTDNAVAAGDAVGGIGRGVLSVASAARWAIPAVALVVVGVWLYGRYLKVKTS